MALLAAVLLSGCPRENVSASASEATPAGTPAPAATPAPVPAPTPEPATPSPEDIVILAAGKPAVIAPGMTLTYLRIVNDSRCPAGVQCVWAGEVRIALTLEANGGSTPFELSTHAKPKASHHGLDFELQSFGACPAGTTGAPDSECATMKVQAQPLD